MSKDLTNSGIERQNILNNKYALQRIQDYVGLEGMLFEGEYKFTKSMVASFFNIDDRTLERYLEQYSAELKHNGYVLIRGKSLKELKLQFAPVINVGSKTTQNGIDKLSCCIWKYSAPSDLIQIIIREAGAGLHSASFSEGDYNPFYAALAQYLRIHLQ